MSNEFSYASVLAGNVDADGFKGFRLHQGKGPFLVLQPDSYTHTSQANGLKFDISVAPKDVPRAWDIVSNEILVLAREGRANGMDYDLPARVATPETAVTRGDPSNFERGKMITVFDRKLPLTVLNRFLGRIEDGLIEAGIERGPQVLATDPVPSSLFATSRIDREANGGLVPFREFFAQRDARDAKVKGLYVGTGRLDNDASHLAEKEPADGGPSAAETRAIARLTRIAKGLGLEGEFKFDAGADFSGQRNARILVAKPVDPEAVVAALQDGTVRPLTTSIDGTPAVMVLGSQFPHVNENYVQETFKRADGQGNRFNLH